ERLGEVPRGPGLLEHLALELEVRHGPLALSLAHSAGVCVAEHVQMNGVDRTSEAADVWHDRGHPGMHGHLPLCLADVGAATGSQEAVEPGLIADPFHQ